MADPIGSSRSGTGVEPQLKDFLSQLLEENPTFGVDALLVARGLDSVQTDLPDADYWRAVLEAIERAGRLPQLAVVVAAARPENPAWRDLLFPIAQHFAGPEDVIPLAWPELSPDLREALHGLWRKLRPPPPPFRPAPAPAPHPPSNYLPAMQSPTPMTLKQLEQLPAWTKLTALFGNPGSAQNTTADSKGRELLRRFGFPTAEVPTGLPNARAFWTEVCQQIEAGITRRTLDDLLSRAADMYPGAEEFAPWRTSTLPDAKGQGKPVKDMDASVSEEEVLKLLTGLDSVKLEIYKVVGDYFRFERKVRKKMSESAEKIVAECRAGTGLYHNFLVWGSPGDGKTYFATQLAQEAGIGYHMVNLAKPGEVADEVALKRHLAEAQAKSGPYLFIIDEADHPGAPWICSALYGPLSERKGNPNGNVVCLLIGSTGESPEAFWTYMEKRDKGRDLRTRIPPGQTITIPTTTLPDRLLVVFGQIRRCVRAKSRSVNRIDKLALAYVLLSPGGAKPRGIEDLVVKAVDRLKDWETELRYGHFFDPNDGRNQSFVEQYGSAYKALRDDSLDLE